MTVDATAASFASAMPRKGTQITAIAHTAAAAAVKIPPIRVRDEREDFKRVRFARPLTTDIPLR